MKFKFLEAKYVTNDIDVAYFGQSAENALISSCLHILDSMANLISCSLRPNKPSFEKVSQRPNINICLQLHSISK